MIISFFGLQHLEKRCGGKQMNKNFSAQQQIIMVFASTLLHFDGKEHILSVLLL
jgi:hypothetical protein